MPAYKHGVRWELQRHKEPRRSAPTLPGVVANLKAQADMNIVLSVLAVFARLLKPTQGLHSDPSGYVRAVIAEFRRRSRRVRPFVAETVTDAAPLVPAPRKPVDPLPRTLPTFRVPADYVPIVEPLNVAEPAELVRGHYRALEARRERERVDQQRLAVAVLMDLADRVERVEVAR